MIKKSSILLFGFLWALCFSAVATTGHDVEDGAGGVVTSKGVMTIGDSKVPFAKKVETVDAIPGMAIALKWLSDVPMQSFIKSKILANLLPGTLRNYHRSDIAASSTQNQVDFAAVTDKNLKVTVLLPEFYQLQDQTEQAKILFRESLSCISFSTEVSADHLEAAAIAFQNLLKAPKDPKAMNTFYVLLSDFFKLDLVLFPSLDFDLKYNSSFTPYKGRIPATQLFGMDFMQCWVIHPAQVGSCVAKLGQTNSKITPLCATSLFCKALAEYFLNFNPQGIGLTLERKICESQITNDSTDNNSFMDHIFFSPVTPSANESLVLELYQDLTPVWRLGFK